MPTKSDIQAIARAAFAKSNHWGLLAMATGTGKSKIGVDESVNAFVGNLDAKVYLVVPTTKLRDCNWEEEFVKWSNHTVYRCLDRYCYASISKVKGQVIDLVIFDESHNITEANSVFFKDNTIKRALFLTATPPNPNGSDTDKEKVEILNRLKVPVSFVYSLDQAVDDGLVAKYIINVVECNLDSTNKYIKGGTVKKPFMQTEKVRYEYLNGLIRKMQFSGNDAVKFKILERMHFIYKLKSKTEIARRVIARWTKPGQRFIGFCGSIEQAEDLYGKQNVYHSKSKDTALTAFMNLELDELGVVKALNEGINIQQVDGAFIVQLNSNPKDLVQRIGRTIRFRKGYQAVIWIFVVMDTVDEKWFKAAIEEFDKARIVYHHYKNVI